MVEEPQTTTIRFYNIDEVESAPDLEPVWGNWFFRDCVVLQVGNTGSGKTTFNFSFSKAMVDNKPFLGVEAVVENPRVLYMEFEASKSLIKSRMRAMGGYPKNREQFKLYIRENEFHTMEQIVEGLKGLEFIPDIIFVDPIRLAFNMREENDNAEGTRQMKITKQIARYFNCCVVLVHHPSKADMGGTNKGAGASSRVSLADVNMNFDRLFDTEGVEISPDLFALSIPKNRMIDDDFCLCIKKVADGRTFKVVDFPSGARFSIDGIGSATERYTVQQLIASEILGLNQLRFRDIKEAVLRVKPGITDQAIHQALNNLVAIGIAEHNDSKNRLYWKIIKPAEK